MNRSVSVSCFVIVVVEVILIGNYVPPVNTQISNIQRDARAFKKSEHLIKVELQAFEETDLTHEIKLTRVDQPGGLSFFYPYKNIQEEQLFTWKTKSKSVIENAIVIGRYESVQNNGLPGVWLSDAFIALRKVEDQSSPEKTTTSHYYALIVYVRKDSSGTFLEWDRWSPKIIKGLMTRETEEEVSEVFSVDTFLCVYGTCACAACDCSAAKTSKAKGSKKKKGRVQNSSPKISTEVYNTPPIRNTTTTKTRTKALKRTKPTQKSKHGIAKAVAYSIDGNAHTYAAVKGKGDAHSVAYSEKGIAVAEARTTDIGDSIASAKGNLVSISEANSGTGDAKSTAISNSGVAQSSAISKGGAIEAKATKTGEDELEYNYYDVDDKTDDATEIFDALSLVKETNKAFLEAAQRSQKTKYRTKSAIRSDDLCSKEYDMDVQITLDEWNMQAANGTLKDNYEGEHMPMSGGTSFFFKNPLRFGIDFDVGINTSVLITTRIQGHVVARESCCNLKANSSAVLEFLTHFKQDCNPDLELQVGRLEKFLGKDELQNLVQTKKLTITKQNNLVPLVFINTYKNQDTIEGAKVLKSYANGTTSDQVNLIASILVHTIQYAMTDGIYHTVKILKGLGFNIRSVWTGIMLEFKRCRVNRKQCDEKYLYRLKVEKEVILGLYLYMRFAEARHYTMSISKVPMESFISFLKLHKAPIAKLAYCKARRVILSNKIYNKL